MLEKIMDISKSEKKSYYQKRLLSEMKFAMLLSQKNHGKYDTVIQETERYVEETCREEGIIDEEIMRKAEEILMPVSEEAKTYELMCVAHAHIDMNWQWGWDETVKVVLDTTKSILRIMEEYPEFKFSQSQASVYKILEEYAPRLLEEVKARVQEGRWEVSASTWVEADKNMPNGESAARQILYAKKYLSQLLNISMDDMVLDFEPDTFGHSAHVPEILKNAGIKYYYHCRGMNDCNYQLYVWRAPSGAEVLANRERNFYFVNVNPEMAFHAFSTSELTGIKKTLHVYGVGDHGGGPTRRDVERLLDMDKWPIYPSFHLSTYREFFEAAEKFKEQLPVYEGEINCIFDGCFTSQSRNKNGNKEAEELLYKTEVFSALASAEGNLYQGKKLEETWRKVLLNQFHDIVTGSGVRETREYALGMYQEVKASADSIRNDAYDYIASHIDTTLIVKEEEISRNEPDLARSYGAGVGSGQVERGSGNTRIFHIFNPLPETRQETVEILLWEWYGDPNRIQVTDEKGNAVPCQVLEGGYHNYWYHNYMKLIIQPMVPGMGYTTIKLTEGELKQIPIQFHWERRHQEKEELILENNLLRVKLNREDGSLESVLEKETGRELLDTTRKTGVFQYILEANHKAVSEWRSEMSSWLVGRFKKTEILNDNLEVTVRKGKLRESVFYEMKFHNSSMKVEVALDADSRSLDYRVICDWHEIGTEEKGVPRLQFLMPLPYKDADYIQDIPFGIVSRKELGTDTPAVSFTAAYGEEAGIAVTSKNTYGYRCENDSIALAMLRSSFEPDLYPENGICLSEFSVVFFEKKGSGRDLIAKMRKYHVDMDVVSGEYHTGSLPLENSYFHIEGKGVIMTALKVAEDGNGLILRLHETEGNKQKAALCWDRPVRKAIQTDLLERDCKGLPCSGCKAEIEMEPYSIATVKMQFS